MSALLELRGLLVVNRDRLVNLGRWERVLARGVPDHLYASYDALTRRLVLRIPGLIDQPSPYEVHLQVHRRQSRVCVYLPAFLPTKAGPKKHGLSAGAHCGALYSPTRLSIWRIR
ncbi:MAG: hypothetical protein M0035_06095 [Actinomycetota bacterium]|nr:hypothetical protein [Actinomycetota bacterium]